MGICGDASTWAKVAAILDLIGLPLFISGYATPAWMVSETIRQLLDVSIGLWQVNDCSSGSCKTSSVPDSYKTGKDIPSSKVIFCGTYLGVKWIFKKLVFQYIMLSVT